MTFTSKTAYTRSRYNTKYDAKKYIKILRVFFYGLSKLMIYDKYEYKLPYGGGTLKITKTTQTKKKCLDYGHFNKTGEKRFHINRHTSGYYFFFFWDKRKSKYANYKLYKFEVTRGNDKIIGARGLAKHIKECSENPLIKDYDVVAIR